MHLNYGSVSNTSENNIINPSFLVCMQANRRINKNQTNRVQDTIYYFLKLVEVAQVAFQSDMAS